MVESNLSFTVYVMIAGINPYVDVPEQVVSVLGGEKKLAVLVKVDGMDSTKNKAIIASKRKKLEKDAARLKAIGRLDAKGWFRSTLVPLR